MRAVLRKTKLGSEVKERGFIMKTAVKAQETDRSRQKGEKKKNIFKGRRERETWTERKG